jgi:tripartite-type tricarboxylate transporter receptor subunit TctC
MANALPLVREGKVRPLAVTSRQRVNIPSSVPSFWESGYAGFEVTGWLGLVAPSGTPQIVVERLQRAVAASLNLTEVRAKLIDLDLEVAGSSPEEFDRAIKVDAPRWARAIRELGLKLD